MEDRIFNLFRELVNRRDGELARLLGVSRVPVRHRASSSGLSIPGLTHMVTVNTSFTSTRRDILDELKSMMDDPFCDKKAILDKLGEKLSWQGIAELFYILMKRDGSLVDVSDELLDERWENYSMEKPHYKIKVAKRNDSGHNTIGDFDVNLFDGQGGVVTIKFGTQLDKVLYMWFLLHPRQQMTIDDLWKEIYDENSEVERPIIRMSRLMYTELNTIIGRDIVRNRKMFNDEFRKIKSRINTNIKAAWEQIGSMGRPEWYTLEGNLNKNPNKKDSLYHINLYPDSIIFYAQEGLTGFRKEAGYPSVDENEK